MREHAKVTGADWKFEEDVSFVMEFSDETGEDRTEAEMDAFADELSEVAGKYGFDKSHWGPKEAMVDSYVREREFTRKLMIDVFRKMDRDEV